MNPVLVEVGLEPWFKAYKELHRDLLEQDPCFAQWLEAEYVPLAGGWMY
jgi:hypothetical protein